MRIEDIPRLSLGTLPTPITEAPRLAREIGLRRLLIKRDDLTGLGLGGNKVRKLEFLMAEAVAERADIILTDGGPQSNHARLTAAAAKVIGRDAILFLGGPKFDAIEGNLLLDTVFGAEIRFIPNATVGQMENAMATAAMELRLAGRRPYVIPIGGSTPLGALGYVEAMRELAEQLEDERCPQIVLAVGSGGTLGGVLLGTRIFMPNARVIGIAVGRASKPFQNISSEIAEGAADMLGLGERFDHSQIEVREEFLGPRYGVPSEEAIQAILLAARKEGLVLDPVYTGKAMAGLIGLAREGILEPHRTTVFLHTGGAPALFAFGDNFRAMANIKEIELKTEE